MTDPPPATDLTDPGPGPRGRSLPVSRRSLLATGLMAATAPALTACPGGSGGGPAGAVADPDVLTWYASSISQSQNDPRRILVDVFERDNLGLKVREESGNARTDAMRENLRRNISAGDARLDVYLGDVVWPADFADDGIAAPLDAILPDDFWTRFDESHVDASSYDGAVYAAPFFSDQGMLFYRTDLVSRPPATWHELADTARTIQAGRDISGFVWQGDAYEGLTCCWTEFAAGAGTPLPSPDHPDAPLDTVAARAALRFVVDLIRTGISPRDVVHFQEPQAMQVFNAGRAVFMRGWDSAWASMNDPAISEVADHVGVAPLPTFDETAAAGGGFSTAGGWSLFLNPNSRKQETAGRFLDWMTAVPAQKILARFAVIPTNREVREDADLTANHEPLRVAGRSTRVFRPSGFPHYPELSRALHGSLHRALTGELRPDEALRKADRAFHAVRLRHSGGQRGR